MIFSFLIVSDEVDDFVREVEIDSKKSFLDLHLEIVKAVGFNTDTAASFYICNKEWEREKEISFEAMQAQGEGVLIMKEVLLETFFKEKGQRLMYVFDLLFERAFFMELSHIDETKTMMTSRCVRSEGKAPVQEKDLGDFMGNEEPAVAKNRPAFDDDELDMEMLEEFDHGIELENYEDIF